jgi:hypothetical protein
MLTDAVPFCKIDQRNQQEFLDAYYDKEKGIEHP